MPIAVTDLLAPEGPVEESFFEGENIPSETDPSKTKLEVRLGQYIDRAYAKADEDGFAPEVQDSPVKNYALYLTFHAIYLLRSSAPASRNRQELGLGTKSYLKEQIAAFENEALKYLKLYEAEVETIPPLAGGSVIRQYAPAPVDNIYTY